jgi:ATP-dependent helicase/nuclease subunit B
MYGWLPEVCDGSSQVVTASRRLARLLIAEYTARQLAAGERAWLTPVIAAWPDWLSRLLATGGPGVQPVRINGHQSRVLWESILRELVDDPLVNVPSLARQARDAWNRLHEWLVPFEECVGAANGRDQRLFAAAASRYRARLADEHWIDEATIGLEVAGAVRAAAVPAPDHVVFAGFDRLTPAADALIAALRERGSRIDVAAPALPASDASVVVCDDRDTELRSAGAWARRQLDESPGQRIGIVVSNLEQDAARAGRLVREGFVPGWQYAAESQQAAVNVSFGRRLPDYPAIEIALLLLRWTHSAIRGTDLGLLIRTPFLGSTGVDARARLELELRRMPDRHWTPALLLEAIGTHGSPDAAPDWLARLAKLEHLRRSQRREAKPAHWAGVVDELLEEFGWPGAAALESADFQLVNRWRDLLNDFARLDLVMPRITLGQAVGQLSAMASDTVFQPEMEGAAIQVLGPLEAAGIEFDQVWVAGLTASQWPPAGRPMALVSRRLQRHYGMPDSEPGDTATYARRVIDRLLRCAGSCICSYPARSDDSIETPTALLADVPAGGTPADPQWHAAQLCGMARPAVLPTDRVPPVVPTESVAGGAATIQSQMTEPFSAFALGRLGISPLRPIVPGLSPILRGVLIHGAAFHLYESLPCQTDIANWSGEELEKRIEAATRKAFGRHERDADPVLRELLGLERERVAKLLRELVGVDVQRDRFRVHALEASMDIELSGVRLGLRIDRIDRYDDGGLAILDYKTGGRRKFLDSSGEPTDAQLLVYAMAAGEDIASLGFFNIDSRETALDASGRDVMGADEWRRSLSRWTRAVEIAAGDFAAGDVRIRYWQTLREARPLNILSRFGELRRDA